MLSVGVSVLFLTLCYMRFAQNRAWASVGKIPQRTHLHVSNKRSISENLTFFLFLQLTGLCFFGPLENWFHRILIITFALLLSLVAYFGTFCNNFRKSHKHSIHIFVFHSYFYRNHRNENSQIRFRRFSHPKWKLQSTALNEYKPESHLLSE